MRPLSLLLFAGTAFAQQQSFTAAQATAGRTAYEANCVTCHQADLRGGVNEAPPLSGPDFLREWSDKTAADLIAFIRTTMPPANANLNAQTCTEIAAYLLQRNGAQASNQALAANSTATIRTLAAARQTAQAAPPGGRGGANAAAPQQPATPRGITISGEVKNYAPVTDAMLRNPDPNDW